MSDPLVSVLVTAYNAEPWLAETLGSALAQTYPNVEVVVVDDGSTDGTLRVARGFEGPRVQVVGQVNAGACAARNRALAESNGDLVQYLDADDLLAPDKIERQVARLRDEPEGTVASGPWARFRERPGDLGRGGEAGWEDYEPAVDFLVQSWSPGGGMMPNFGWLTPRPLVDAAGPWDERLRKNQDGEFFARVLAQAARVAFCPGAWGYYRSGVTTSVSARRGADVAESLFAAAEGASRAVLGRLDTDAARRACASLWMGVAFQTYPVAPEVGARAEARAAALGGSDAEPGGGRAFQVVRDALGWKAAVRFQHVWYRLRYGR
ncbi:glycosyltransferase family 2 protein [Rubrivirga litoralis]|uniref:Glycosyltransferase family A protein n=1 Tax=Rubrivirga litoralis TaxID=3075598 RepID=A0ABU3BSF8_9BACT|nr:glycosyltransferase family A protein [Rubrivirga sp. F394]MDT0632213.1 glycosyltransferase family A protein [Rubrivirga sp. F394]